MIQGLRLQPETKLAAMILAEKSFERYRNIFGHYRNTANGHLVGHLGEFAAFIWLRDNGFEPVGIFTDPERDKECDISTIAARIEVKTWSHKHWDDLGRAVSVSQLSRLKKKADIVFFCSADEVDSPMPKIQFRGWVEVAAFDSTEPKMTGFPGREIYNHQLEDSDLKRIDTLKGLL